MSDCRRLLITVSQPKLLTGGSHKRCVGHSSTGSTLWSPDAPTICLFSLGMLSSLFGGILPRCIVVLGVPDVSPAPPDEPQHDALRPARRAGRMRHCAPRGCGTR